MTLLEPAMPRTWSMDSMKLKFCSCIGIFSIVCVTTLVSACCSFSDEIPLVDVAQRSLWFMMYYSDARAICQSPRKDGLPFLRRRVWGTACIYMREFYRDQSFATADPRQFCLASLLLASKVEETPIHTRDLVAVAINLASNSPDQWPLPPSPEQVVSAEARIMVCVTALFVLGYLYSSLHCLITIVAIAIGQPIPTCCRAVAV